MYCLIIWHALIRQEKSKSHKEDDHRHQISGLSSSFYSSPSKQAAKDKEKLKLKDDSKNLDPKKDSKGKESPIEPSSKPILASGSSVSPILASSLGLNKIKTRSGPLPQESFFGFRSEKSAGASNLSRPATTAANSASGKGSGRKEAPWLENVAESGSTSDIMSPGSDPSTGRSPSTGNVVQPRSRLSSEADLELMKERFAKLLLGEDMSGGGKGVGTALAITNAITNLAASVFGELWRLEPFAPQRKKMWCREMDWLLCV